ncbi:hypothetical protein [uncultured Croceitalea sp.]|uniref:hypothetical protein n=1 Tax=uncultured Croceitalea sp. TaxID=1798908 RepID=UPI00374E906A
MDKQKLKEALIALEKEHINEDEMKYTEFLNGNLLTRNEVVDSDDQSHHRQSIEISDQLEEQAHVHLDHLETINKISFETKEMIEPGAVVSVNGRCMVVAVPKSSFSIDGIEYIGISAQAPIYQAMKGKASGDSFEFNNQNFVIESVN